MTVVCPLCNAPKSYPPKPADDRWPAIIARVTAKYGLSVSALRNGRRVASIVAIRQEAMWELRQIKPPLSYQDCARAVGLESHATAMWAVRRHQARIDAEVSRHRESGSGEKSPAETRGTDRR